MAASPEQFRGQARFPRCASPLRYDLRLCPDLAACAFSGSAAVDVAVSAPTRFLVLNAAELAVDRSSVRFQDLAPSEVVRFEEDEILVIGFDQDLPIGEGVLKMDFTGTLNDQMRGFYRSKYEYKGESKNMAVTQFEAADARRCFPCWDEPAFKENWDHVLKTWPSSSLISDFVKSTVSRFTTEEKAAEVSEFFAGKIKPSFERALKQSVERVRISARWIESIRSEPSLVQTVHELLQHGV